MNLRQEIAEAFAEVASADLSKTTGFEFRQAFTSTQSPSGAQGRWFVTPHAIDRFRQRTRQSHLTYEQALGAIIDESTRSHKVKDLDGGAQLWRGPKPRRLRYVVVDDGVGLPVLATVLFSFDAGEA